MKKKLVMIVTSLILLIASLSTMGIAHANQNKTPDTRYYFGDWEPGNTYHAQITQYQRYGPLKNEIESKSDLLYGPESSVKDITIVIDDNGDLDTITYDVNSSSGEKWYTYITKKNGNTVYDHKTKKYYEGHSIPIQNFKKRETYRPHYGDIYTQLGWEKRGTKIFNGLNVLIFNLSKPVKDQQEPLPSGQYETPVTYDFSPVIREYETLIDSVSGVVIAYSVFGVDTYGNKILLRSFSLDRLERVKS